MINRIKRANKNVHAFCRRLLTEYTLSARIKYEFYEICFRSITLALKSEQCSSSRRHCSTFTQQWEIAIQKLQESPGLEIQWKIEKNQAERKRNEGSGSSLFSFSPSFCSSLFERSMGSEDGFWNSQKQHCVPSRNSQHKVRIIFFSPFESRLDGGGIGRVYGVYVYSVQFFFIVIFEARCTLSSWTSSRTRSV